MKWLYLITFGIFYLIHEFSAVVYVGNTPYAKDGKFCGVSPTRPCSTLEGAFKRNDKSIRLIGSTIQTEVFKIWNTIEIKRDIEITVQDTDAIKPVIKLTPNLIGVHYIFTFGKAFQTPRLTLRFISFKDTNVIHFGSNGILNISNCTFSNVASQVINGAFADLTIVTILIEKSVFKDCDSVITIFQISLESQFNKNLNLTFIIVDSFVAAPTTTISNLTSISSGNFSDGILISIPSKIASFTLKVIRTTFCYLKQAVVVHTNQEEKMDFTITDSMFHDNSIIMKSLIEDEIQKSCPSCIISCGSGVKYSGKGTLLVTSTIFNNNSANRGGAVCIFGPEATFQHITFNANKAVESGGACYVTSSAVLFNHSNFISNSASLSNSGLQNQNKLDSTGYGGAIRSNGDVTVRNSQFIDNHAFVFGGSICHDGEKLNLTGNSFIGPKEYGDTSLHGSILYTKSLTHLGNNSFYSSSSNSQGSVLFHSSNDIELYIKPTFKFSCKTGEEIIRSYNHRNGKTQFSLLIFICKPCADGNYSLQRETMFLIRSHKEKYTNIQCQPCPEGGICKNGNIRSLSNFWGWKTRNGKEIKFLSCPTSTYCCSKNNCPTYNSCSLNRVGRLCGQCIKNYSESVFSSVCIPNEMCMGAYIWPSMILVGFCYVFVLLYFKDIFSYIKLLILKPVAFLQRINITNHTTDLDDLDNLYVGIGGCDAHETTVIPHYTSPDEPITTNDEASMINSDDDTILDDSTDIMYQTLDNDATNSASERMIACDSISICRSSNRKKIKWYSYLFGIFKIFAFFYQMQLLSKVPSALESSYKFNGPQFLKEFVTGIFNIKMTGSFFSLQVCIFKDVGPILKRYLKILFLLFLFVILIGLYLVRKIVRQLWKIFSSCGRCIQSQENADDDKQRLPLSIRIKCCMLQLMLLSYSTVSTATFELIYCVQIDDISEVKKYNYINANEECKGSWYIFAQLLASIWSVPFFIAVFGANKLLRDRQIRVGEFLLILLFPPFLLYFVGRNIFRRYKRIELTAADIQTRDHVLQVLEMPFQKKITTKSVWYWESMLILRRLIIVCIYVFLPNPITRLYVMCIPLTLFLVDHLRVQPYNSRLLNWLETASLLCLVFLVSINLFWAYNYETNVPISKNLSLIAQVFLYVETVVLLLPLIIIALIIVVAIGRKIGRKIVEKIRKNE